MRSSRNARQKAVAIFLVVMLVLTCIKTEAIKYVFADEVSGEVSGIHTATDADAEYVEAQKTLKVYVEESGCTITVNAPEGSLPYPEDELILSAKEIESDTSDFNSYLNEAAQALGMSDAEDISYARFFDISILRNGEEIEPESPVEVKIEYDDAPEISDGADLSIVHFADDGTEVIADVDVNNDATEIVYEQDSFSVTATIVADASAVDPVNKYGKTFALVAEYNGKYYTVQYDGSLREVTKSGNDVTANDFLMWTYVKLDGKNYLRNVAEGYDFDSFTKLSTTFAYAYIDPEADSGITTETPIEGTSNPTKFESPTDHCALIIDSEGHIKTESGKFLSVDASGTKIIGNSTDGGSVKFLLADATSIPDCYNRKSDNPADIGYGQEMFYNHQVNHIDISVADKVKASIPLAYGRYYDKDKNLVLNVTEFTNIDVTVPLTVTQDTLRSAEIKAFTGSGDNKNYVDNAFLVTGYSSNDEYSSEETKDTNQVRIEGVFKVADLADKVWPWDGRVNEIDQARLDNQIRYSITAVQPDVEFKFIYKAPGTPEDEEGVQLYDSQGNALSVVSDVTLYKEFGYFDPENTCPILYMNPADTENWRKGKIHTYGTSGMDFRLEGSTDIEMKLLPVAINVHDDVRDSKGNIIKPATPIKDIEFNVNQNTHNPDPDSVKGKNVDKHEEDIDLTEYTDNNHKIKTTIDETGSSVVNDYNVYPGMVNVEENINTIPKTIVDVDGNKWIYRYTYIETEYVNRLDGIVDKNHVSDRSTSGLSSSDPEVLGDYKAGTTDRYSQFVEFFAHNVYDKVIPPTKEEISPDQGTGTLCNVDVGDEIEYKISYTNYCSENADVVIEDVLDSNVEFVSASNDGVYDKNTHKVTWNMSGVTAGASGYVTLKVKVLEGALSSKQGLGKVVNGGDTATVQIGNDPAYKLDKVENPVNEYTPENPHKKETAPYEGNGELGPVNVGDEISYQISYKNYKTIAADVVIVDKLDANVEFVSASNGGTYDAVTHTVTWNLLSVPRLTEGNVTLKVKVLEGALSSKQGPGKVVNGGSTATVKVGNDDAKSLEVVENPVPDAPKKEEKAPYKGNGVLGAVDVGDEIEYEISYKNYKGSAADVVIVDKLDKNVKFVEASNGVYDLATHTVTWTFKDLAAQTEGTVNLKVQVLEGALASKGGNGKVVNGGSTATVQVGNDSAYTLDLVENPVNEYTPENPHKKEIAPYVGNGELGPVNVGDEISYQISYKNYKTIAADVVIVDKLDANVEFVSASNGGTYDAVNHTVTWNLTSVPKLTEGNVTLKVKVLEGALSSKQGPGKVVNGGSTATVKVGNDAEFTLDKVENPVEDVTPPVPSKEDIPPVPSKEVTPVTPQTTGGSSKEPETPKNTTVENTPGPNAPGPKAPATGDTSPLSVAIIMLLVSMMAVVLIGLKKKNRKTN